MTQATNERLTHLVYEASLDNSLLPELILELTEQVQIAADGRMIEAERRHDLSDLMAHFRRAIEISEKMVRLQERESDLEAVLGTLAVGIALVDDSGRAFVTNRAMRDTGLALDGPIRLLPADAPEGAASEPQSLTRWVSETNRVEIPKSFVTRESDTTYLLLPRQEAIRMGFPAKAAAVLVATNPNTADGLRALATAHDLSLREQALVRALMEKGDLRAASEAIGISYESGRTYLKRVFEKTGLKSQVDLINTIARNPLSMFRERQISDDERFQVRRLHRLSDGRMLEYFILGPETGRPVVLFDALSGSSIDLIGFPRRYLEHLEHYGVRLIMPCRPGIYRSDFRKMTSLRDFAPDLQSLIDMLGYEQVSLMSFSFGSGIALATTHELPDRVKKVLLSSPSYPEYKHDNWRELDQFYHLSAVLAQRWPAMFRQLIPFLVRSIIQNGPRYMDRYCKRSPSADDIALLSHPTIGIRSSQMLEERTAGGVEGMVEENLLNARGWDFDVAAIGTEVEIYHGAFDNVAPAQGGAALAERLPNATYTRFEDKGHYQHISSWPWMVARAAGLDVAPYDRTYSIPDL
ncbi:alpha/beta fold hydrolase [Marivita hallyeonensis]|uniref:Pimeloyl-ACP methyl ester carboxylesterase n=1 Tax=Marivita hallyeonensis TaxID=996342 RepID=A0A1M5TCD5_9RHOB|nr:alpha/beta fold hydrolase [Marivita hallyeonensis]SHH48379.1 Pimeloyl-ACP methyl ester carboxylesterase [Marivita hallyeonensis]